MNFPQIQIKLNSLGVEKYRFTQLVTAVNQGALPLWPKSLFEHIRLSTWTKSQVFTSADGTKKATLTLADDKIIETVLIEPKPGHVSICVSCEVGCPMNCAFCATGKMGFSRKLTAEEITDQILFWKNYLAMQTPKNQPLRTIKSVVFMGMGEPFHNQTEVFSAIRDLSTYYGFGNRHISVSTCGIPDGIMALETEFPQVNLALSLHAATEEVRMKLMPVTKAYPLTKLKPILKHYIAATHRQLMFEYLLIDGVNDRDSDRQALVDWLDDFDPSLIHVNLIRYNQTFGAFVPTSIARVKEWKKLLALKGISVSIRKNLGVDIAGACGQLAARPV